MITFGASQPLWYIAGLPTAFRELHALSASSSDMSAHQAWLHYFPAVAMFPDTGVIALAGIYLYNRTQRPVDIRQKVCGH